MRDLTKTFRFAQTVSVSLLGGLTSLVLGVNSAQAGTIAGIDFLGQAVFPTDTSFGGTQVGGLSGITYDASKKVYYSIADDRSQINPARFYTFQIDLSGGSLSQSGVKPVGVTTLRDANGQPFALNSIDLEGIALTDDGTLFVSSEGEVNPTAGRVTNPFVNEFSLITGTQVDALPVPSKFSPVPGLSGIRNNLALESLTLTPDQTYLFTATENALVQDGPAASLTTGTPSRILKYDLTTDKPVAEFLYNTEPVALPSVPDTAFNTNGLVDLLALDDSGEHFLALERSFSTGAVGTPGNTGNTVKLFQVSLDGATDISGIDSLTASGLGGITAAKKELLLDFTTLGIAIDNIEGISFGPDLADGRQSLVIVSDNNFSPTQFTQFLAFGITPARSVPEPSALAGLVVLGALGLSAQRRSRV